MPAARWFALAALAAASAACGDDEPTERWEIVKRDLPGALISVWGSSATDVWAVGGDAGDGPEVHHFDGAAWQKLDTGERGDLWWVFGFAGGPIYMGGAGGMILRYQDGGFTRMSTPGTDTVFGIWGARPDDVWAVGGATGGSQGAFAWRLTGGDTWQAAAGFPAELAETDVMWKMFGRAADDAWLVGTNGTAVFWDGEAFAVEDTGIGESLFTVHGYGQRYVAVGGFGTGAVLENDGSGWVNVSPPGGLPLIGVCATAAGGYAVGQFGAVSVRGDDGWAAEDTELPIDESLHGVWVDPDGGVWAAGGQVVAFPLVDGILLHKGRSLSGGES